MSKQKWRRRKVPRWLVRCAPHQAIGGLIPPDVCFGAGCRPEDLISRGLSSPCHGGPRVRIHLPPAARWYGAGGEEMAPSSLQPNRWSVMMPQPNDLSRSLVALDQDST